MGASLIKSVASSTNSLAGDGTTTATVLAQAIYTEGRAMVAAGHNPVLVKRGIDLAVETAINHLREISVKITSEDMVNSIAVISANNDKKLGALISEVVSSVGEDGLISVEESAGAETSVSYTDGLSIDRGYITPAFSTNIDRLTVEYDNPFILFYDGRISKTSDLMTAMSSVAETGRPLLVLAQTVENEALQTMILNNSKGSLKSCAVRAPGFGDIRRDMLGDLSAVCGGRVFNSDTDGQLREVTLADLGQARRVVVSRDSTSIVDGMGSSDAVEGRVNSIKSRLNGAGLEAYEIAALRQRLSSLVGSVALVRVGGVSDTEVRERRDRVEDAINAVKAAIEEGVVPGGGSALLRCVPVLHRLRESGELTTEEIVGINVVAKAICAPFSQILTNAGENYHLHMETILTSDNNRLGYNALYGRLEEDMIAAGIIDPLKVVRTGLENAASSSGTLLTTEVAIFTAEESS